MSTVSKTSRWLPRLFALLAGALVAGSATFWALRLSAPRSPGVQAPAGDTAPEALPVDAARLSALLGAGGASDKAASASAAPAAPALASRFVEMNVLPPGSYDPRKAMARVPPLIKGYLRLGGFVGDGAVIDREFDSTDVFIIVKTELVTEKYIRHYERGMRDAES